MREVRVSDGRIDGKVAEHSAGPVVRRLPGALGVLVLIAGALPEGWEGRVPLGAPGRLA